MPEENQELLFLCLGILGMMLTLAVLKLAARRRALSARRALLRLKRGERDPMV